MVKRKRRTDRTHIIYVLTRGRSTYVGITAKTCSTVAASLRNRVIKHARRAVSENRPWPLYEAMRRYGAESFDVKILEVGRGKAWAHRRERELIREIKPSLNLA